MLKFIKNLLFLFIIGQVIFGCNQRQPDNRFQKSEQNDFSFGKKHKNHRKNTQRQNQVAISTEVPQKVFEVLEYIKANNSAPQGYVASIIFVGEVMLKIPESSATHIALWCRIIGFDIF